MALSGKVFVQQYQIELPEAYCRVSRVELLQDLNSPAVLIDVAVYANAAARQAKAVPVEVRRYVITDNTRNRLFSPAALDTKNPIAQAYDYLKTLPEYANFKDV